MRCSLGACSLAYNDERYYLARRVLIQANRTEMNDPSFKELLNDYIQASAMRRESPNLLFKFEEWGDLT